MVNGYMASFIFALSRQRKQAVFILNNIETSDKGNLKGSGCSGRFEKVPQRFYQSCFQNYTFFQGKITVNIFFFFKDFHTIIIHFLLISMHI